MRPSRHDPVNLALARRHYPTATPTPSVRQAIFGNVGKLVVFRLAIANAYLFAKDLGVFTSEEALTLDVGKALIGSGASAKPFNLETSLKS